MDDYQSDQYWMPEPDDEREAEKAKERLSKFVGSLESEAKRRSEARIAVEQRWIEDLRQYHGIYEPDTSRNLTETKSSQVFINITRTKTDALVSRLWDLLFPTDDKNWGIEPTPVPELDETAESGAALVDDADDTLTELGEKKEQAEQEGDQQALMEAQQQMARTEELHSIAQKAADVLTETTQEAKRRCKLMEDEIEDQLVHSNFQAECRDALNDAAKLGIGILKGPIVGERVKQVWQTGPDGSAVLVDQGDGMPAVKRVDPWGFFPSIDARTPEESEGFYERHLMNPKQMRVLARRPDIDENAVREILKGGPDDISGPNFLPDLQDLTQQQTIKGAKDIYHVWEYTGPIDPEDLETLAHDLGNDTAIDMLEDEEVDPLTEISVRIWFCQGHVLSVAMYPLDSQEPMYSVFTLSPDEYSMFGFGMPYIIRDPQSMLNAATRMMMDNAGLATGPQIVINKDAIHPQDGDYTLRPRKVWIRNKADAAPNSPAFETYNIPGMQAELGGIIEMSRAMIDEMSGMPAIAQGEQGAQVTKTAQGMALLMNSANVTFRRYVKNWDDDITRPIIRRMYHFNMQFSDKEAIKGDYEVKARGSSVLLVREMQASNLMLFGQAFGEHQKFGPRIRDEAFLSEMMRAMNIPAKDLLYSDREYRKKAEEQAKLQQQTDPQTQALQAQAQVEQEKLAVQREKMQMDREIHLADNQTRLQVQQMQIEEARIRHEGQLAVQREKNDTDAAVKLRGEQIKQETKAREIDSQERKLAAEISMKERTGDSAGGSV